MSTIYFLGQIKKRILKLLSNIFYSVLFFLNKPKDNTVLLIEANNSHTELLPSYVKYLKDLKFNVEIIANFEQKQILPHLNADKIYYFNIPAIGNILKLKKIKKYAFIIFTSYRLYYPKPDRSELQSTIFDHFDIKHPPVYKDKTGILYILHHIEDYDSSNRNGAIVLSKILKIHDDLYVVNPCYFKENAPKNKNPKTVFAVTGRLDNSRKNPDLLFDTVNEILNEGIRNFEIKIIGDNNADCIPENLREFIKVKGRLNFEDLYNELETSDFYLPLLDSDSEEHKRYITTGTSGSFQLIRGFLLPPVINSLFANEHMFNDENSIIYNKNEEFLSGMKNAINMDNKTYLNMQRKLLKQRDEIMTDSTSNLKAALNNLIGV